MKNLDGDWQLTLADLQPAEDYSLALQIRGETVKGRSLFLQPTPIILIDRDIPEEAAEIELPLMEEDEAELVPEMEPEAELEEIIEEMPMEEEPLEPELEVIDEMNGNLEDLLPEPDDELLVGLDQEMITSPDEGAVTPAIKLAIGNGIILLLVGIGVFVWRRKSAATNPGDEL